MPLRKGLCESEALRVTRRQDQLFEPFVFYGAITPQKSNVFLILLAGGAP
jgi:hypothetical protein